MTKIKPLTKEQIIISIDRLTRFKNPEEKYLRVFKDIILSNLIEPKYKKSELDSMDYADVKNLAENIINSSLPKCEDYLVNKKLYDYEDSTFILDKNTQKLIDNKINYKECIKLLDGTLPVNLKWLKNLDASNNQISDREKMALRFPVETLVLVEGITEETLLPEFAKLCGFDFDKNGIYVISAGGKNQVVKLFYQYADILRIPMFVLMDKDASKNYDEIIPKLRENDRVHILECGEFEDALPLKLINKALQYGLNNISMLDDKAIGKDTGMVKALEEIFRHRGMHEFKKSEFAQMVKACLLSKEDVSDEIEEIIDEIKFVTQNSKVVVDI